MAKTMDRMAGRPSGTAATASDTPSIITDTSEATLCTSVTSRTALTTSTQITITARPSIWPTRRISFCSGVASRRVSASR